jgi:hypothetical protein
MSRPVTLDLWNGGLNPVTDFQSKRPHSMRMREALWRRYMAKSTSRNPKLPPPAMGNSEVTQAEVLTLEDEWMGSRLSGESDASDQLLDDDYKGATSDGLSQSKSDFLVDIAIFSRRNVAADQSQRHIRVFGEIAVSSGLATVHSPNREHTFRYLRVFRKAGGKWRLIAAQSTRVREA